MERAITGVGADPGGSGPGRAVGDIADDPDSVEDDELEDAAAGGRTEDAEDTELDEPLPDAERLVAEAVALAGDDLDSARLVRRYWRFAPDEDLVGLTPAGMLADARAHRGLAQQRVPGELKLRVEDSADGDLTNVEIVTDDMPFLVDTVTAAIVTRGLSVHLLVHPLVVVRREPLGALVEVCADVEPDDAIAGDLVESWMRLAVDRVHGEAERDALRRDIQRVLTDVREAVEDWPRMRSQALAIADELAGNAASLPVPDRDITDSIELLRWLVDEHFTFLGYREYRLVGGGSPAASGADEGGAAVKRRVETGTVLQAVMGTGLGILRQDSASPRVITTMTPEAQAKVLEKRLLVITKANSRSTVHRSA